jgi:hypothetical protein
MAWTRFDRLADQALVGARTARMLPMVVLRDRSLRRRAATHPKRVPRNASRLTHRYRQWLKTPPRWGRRSRRTSRLAEHAI